jgi:hypothetical protein
MLKRASGASEGVGRAYLIVKHLFYKRDNTTGRWVCQEVLEHIFRKPLDYPEI